METEDTFTSLASVTQLVLDALLEQQIERMKSVAQQRLGNEVRPIEQRGSRAEEETKRRRPYRFLHDPKAHHVLSPSA
jgi:hypothetical protein